MKHLIRQWSCFAVVGLTCLTAGPAQAADNSLLWKPGQDQVTADIKSQDLSKLLEQVASATGWQVFLEPGTAHEVSAKFNDMPPGEALRLLLGDLNFALVPQTNATPRLFVFRTTQGNATQRIRPSTRRLSKRPGKTVPNELIVRLKPGANIDEIARLLGAKVIGRIDGLNAYRLQFDDEAAADAALAQLKSNPDVTEADYNYTLDPPATPQALANSPIAPLSLKLNPSSAGDPCQPVIGVIDTPLQSLGTELDKFISKKLSVAGDATVSSTVPTHGTTIANTILQAVSKVSGGSTPAQIVYVDAYGASETTTPWNVALGLQAAVNNGANVVNMSLGGSSDSSVLNDVIQQALARGVVIFAAAGNQPVKTATYPAADSGVIAVTATQGNQLAPYANSGNFVDLALPGMSVVSFGDQAYAVQGTSVSTAYATGVAAGTRGQNCLPWAQIQSAMQQKFPVPQQ